MFSDQKAIYEGKTGLRLYLLSDAGQIGQRIESNGGMERLNKLIEDSLAKFGLSPRYTRPNETKKEVFPQKEKDDDIVLAKSLSGKKHFYYRFHNENGVELYTRYNQKDMFQTVYVPCEGFMIGIDQNRQVDEILAWLSTLENCIKGEIEKELRTQGWIIGSLLSIQYDTEKQTWSYRHIHNDSTVIRTLLSCLLEADETAIP